MFFLIVLIFTKHYAFLCPCKTQAWSKLTIGHCLHTPLSKEVKYNREKTRISSSFYTLMQINLKKVQHREDITSCWDCLDLCFQHYRYMVYDQPCNQVLYFPIQGQGWPIQNSQLFSTLESATIVQCQWPLPLFIPCMLNYYLKFSLTWLKTRLRKNSSLICDGYLNTTWAF